MPNPNLNKSDPRRKAISDTQVKALSDERKVRVICSTATEDRAGDVVRAEGIQLIRYKQNPVVLFNHDAQHPVARCVEIGVVNGRLEAVVQFPDEGTSQKADETYRLIKAGVINAVSIGFRGLEAEPYGENWGYDFKSSELLEFSFVSVPANPDALIIERSIRSEDGQMTGVEQAELLRRNLLAVTKAVEEAFATNANDGVRVTVETKATSFADALVSVEQREDYWELESALWSAWNSIDNDEALDIPAKSAAKVAAFDAFAEAVRALLAGEPEPMEENKSAPAEATGLVDTKKFAARLKLIKLRSV